MDAANIKDRILAVSDDDPNIHAIYKTGEDDGIEYYLVIAEKQHEGRQFLKIRYFAAHLDNRGDDTWMKNGITARSSDTLISRLADDFVQIDSGATDSTDSTVLRDLSGRIP